MTGEPKSAYRKAIAEFQESRTMALKMIKIIATAHSGLADYLPTFFAANLKIGIDGFDRKRLAEVMIDLDQWPDQHRLRKVLTDWHLALTRAQEAWNRIPRQDRGLMFAPPRSLSGEPSARAPLQGAMIYSARFNAAAAGAELR